MFATRMAGSRYYGQHRLAQLKPFWYVQFEIQIHSIAARFGLCPGSHNFVYISQMLVKAGARVESADK